MKIGKKNILPRYLFVWGSIAIAAFGYVLVTTLSNQATETGKAPVKRASASQGQAPLADIPMIDKVVPPIIETASFGLG